MIRVSGQKIHFSQIYFKENSKTATKNTLHFQNKYCAARKLCASQVYPQGGNLNGLLPLVCPSGKLNEVERRSEGPEADGRQSSTPEKFDTQDDGDGDDDTEAVEDGVRLTRKSTVLPKSKEKEDKYSSSMLDNCGNKTNSRRRFSLSFIVMVHLDAFG